MTAPAEPSTYYTADILSIESGRLLGGGRVRVAPDSPPDDPDWYINTVFGLDRADVILQFSTGLTREVTLDPRDSGKRNQYEYLVRWNGEGRFVPSSMPPES